MTLGVQITFVTARWQSIFYIKKYLGMNAHWAIKT